MVDRPLVRSHLGRFERAVRRADSPGELHDLVVGLAGSDRRAARLAERRWDRVARGHKARVRRRW
ncbi:MAG: hypothetical protein IT372_07880 [Polyangiaceae bacterium]|nr:hypothetical protein [Polyangiaceae bacterium]